MPIDTNRFGCKLDLIDNSRGRVGLDQVSAAIGTSIKAVIMGLVDFPRVKRFALMLVMSGLSAGSPFPSPFKRGILFRVDDVAGGRFG